MAKATSRVVRNPAAVVDIIEVADHIAQTTSLAAADRFIAAVDRTLNLLTGMPGMGTCYEPDNSVYADVRYFPVSKFRKYLIFYHPLPDGIGVFRVLHEARDIGAILAEEFGIEADAGDDAAENEDE